MTYRNTPLQDSPLSPAELLFGRKLKAHLPLLPQRDHVLPKWKEIRQARETVMASRIADRVQTSNEDRRSLPPLNPGQHVLIQDGEGRTPTRWGRSGIVTEVLPFRQYNVKIDGSNRLRLRNRKQLKVFTPPVGNTTTPQHNISIDISGNEPHPPQPVFTSTPTRHVLDRVENPTWRTPPTPPQDTAITAPSDDATLVPSERGAPPEIQTLPSPNQSDSTIPYDISNVPYHPPTRQSTRKRQPVVRLSPKLKGKTHTSK